MERDLLIQEVLRLKAERQAVILAHSYQLPEVQEVADFVGDSLGLAREAQRTKAKVIVFAGVHFMAETAAILNPEKTVLLPDLEAGCSLADSIRPEDILAWKQDHPEGIVVAYVNTKAEVKALADVCVTSANAVEVVARLPKDRPIFFVPDMFLGAHVARVTGRKLDLFPGECHVHAGIREEHLKALLEKHPGAEFMIHPECGCGSSCLFLKPDAKMLSTEGMVRYAKKADAKEFVVATEVGILHRLSKEAPEKTFIPVKPDAICEYMKRITLEKVYLSLKEMRHVIRVPEEVAQKARRALEAMVAVG
ncbi:quinolinate synthase [Thermus scotoductus]|jgi:quinolinate synthase|uniref:Quinolinate synthase n=6 Tax=Thermus scotoductus TaxID=37636 RepID=A0A430SB40_THESC|nr:quinolinate synthase NadA [Thermus scotoductus]RTG95616.1 quinolinate synthase [Thermus scotoductus]RTH09727.1 quinolinate synthase [Thermus scotoductus]RTH10424.1 quinolinate synthase [Thermus scotoductus]RTH12800.1 quinolinate synthase [Thermus scotoductus]RTH17711.1 quinolinate synthase [Thermus scotoductus]